MVKPASKAIAVPRRWACAYVFQIDSDGQCDPRYFASLWRLREQFTVVYGVRTTRDDGLARVLISRSAAADAAGRLPRQLPRRECPLPADEDQ